MTKTSTAVKTLLLCLMSAAFSNIYAQQNFFSDAAELSFRTVNQKRQIVPEKFRSVRLDTSSALSFLRLAPTEVKLINRDLSPVIELPMPDGKTAKFHIWETPCMEPALAKQFPHIKTFTGQGIDDKTATIKIDWNDFGFHAMILSPVTGAIFIDPYDAVTKTNYISYFKSDFKKATTFKEFDLNGVKKIVQKKTSIDGVQAINCIGTQLRTYRIAVACTHEYAIAVTAPVTPTVSSVLSKIVTTINRVSGVYEKELSVKLVLVATESNVIFVTAGSDQFSADANDDPGALIEESQTVIDAGIGSANYDIGHTFSTGGGGLAYPGIVCVASYKARGITGSTEPYGDPYDIDYVAHEIGHQFGANHTFNSLSGACNGNGVSTTNVEPGSGSTIMAYAGICSPENLQANSDPQFHAISFEEITTNYLTGDATCATITATSNSVPTVNAGADYIIPKSTSFVLTGSATDANGDAITYSWEEVDIAGPAGSWDEPSGNAPLFRSFQPTTSPARHFPKLSSQSANTTVIGELLPSYARTMRFRLTARDNRAGGGGVCSDENAVTVNASSGPFVVTSPNTAVTWYVNDFQTITWDVANTNIAPISCSNVSIELSTDGGLTFPVTIIASTPNDGSQEIQVPNNVTSLARIRVKAVGNIFYDISNVNFSVAIAPAATFVFNNPVPVALCGSSSGTIPLASGSLRSFTTAIALSASLNPAGTTVSFGTASLAPGSSTTVTLNNAGSLAAGSYTVRITGVAGAVTKTRDVIFVVGNSANAPALTTPVADAVGVSTNADFAWTPVVSATSYTLELSTSPAFSIINKTVTGIVSTSVTTTVEENTVYYWRIKTVNTCGTGVPGTPSRFKTGYSTCKLSTDVPKDISADGVSTINSTLVIPAGSGAVITDLNVVQLTSNHTYPGELRVSLIGPDNTTVVLFDGLCEGYAEGFNVNVDDQAPATINCDSLGTGPINIIPQTPLSVFNGKNSAGTWTLRILDQASGDGGQLNSWGLTINTGTTTCQFITTPLLTTYTFTGNGNWNNAANWSNSTIPPSPLPANSSIVVNHAAGGQCILNVPQTISAGAGVTVMAGKNLVIQNSLTIQ